MSQATYDGWVPRIVTDRRLPKIGFGICWRAALALSLASGGPLPATGSTEVTMARTAGQPGASMAASASRPGDVGQRLPAMVAGWTRKGPARTIEPSAIFEYMDGAGELYRAYRFDRLELVEYGSGTGGDILVELYWMGSSDDAFGLLSGDWGGESVELRPSVGDAQSPWPRALYGSGLLRIWSDDLYARVFASRDSEAAHGAVLALGRVIAEGRTDPAPPRLATTLPTAIAPDFRLRQDRLCYLRSHLVLNSVYFLGQRDMLDLGPSVSAVIAPYERRNAGLPTLRSTALAVRYPTPELALRALAHFRAAYLTDAGAAAETDMSHIEDGWVGSRLVGRSLALVFEAPDREAARALLSGVVSGLERLEGSHE